MFLGEHCWHCKFWISNLPVLSSVNVMAKFCLCCHRIDGDDGVEIHPGKAVGAKGYLATLQSLLQQVPGVIVQGIPTVERAVVEKTSEGGRSVLPAYAACCIGSHQPMVSRMAALSIIHTLCVNSQLC